MKFFSFVYLKELFPVLQYIKIQHNISLIGHVK